MNISRQPLRATLLEILRKAVLADGIHYTVKTMAAIGAAAAWALVAGDFSWWWRVLLIVGGGALIALDVVVGRLRVRWETEYEREVATELLGMIRSYYIPILARLAPCAHGTPKKGEALASVEQSVLSAAHSICGPHDAGVRAVLFEVQRGRLRPKNGSYVGGDRPSLRTFQKSSKNEADKAAWEAAASGEPMIYKDLAKDPPPGFKRSASNYSTFMTCGILDQERRVVGMLSVDAPRPGDLSGHDAVVLKLLCETLAVAYDVSKGGTR